MTPPPHDARPAHDRRWLLAAVCLAALALPLSFSGGALAVPAISRSLGGSAAALNWVTNAFMLAFGSLLMAAGALADRYGRRRLFLGGTGAFAACALALCGTSSILVLDVLRALQGVAAAAALASGTAALAQAFEGHARTRAFSLLGTTFGIGLAAGPLLAGALIEHWGWRSVFASGAVLGAGALFLSRSHMRDSHDPDAAAFDWAGAATFTGMLSLLTIAVLQAPSYGWDSAIVRILLCAAAVLLGLFVLAEKRSRRPMLDLSLFRYPRFIGVQVLPIATCYGYVVLLVLLPLHLVGIAGLGEARAGLLLLALSAPMLVVPFVAASLARRWSAGALCGGGLLLAAFGLAWLGQRIGGEPVGLVAPLLLIGTGTGLPWGLMDDLSVSVVPKSRAGMAAGIFGTTRVAGEGIALALVGALLAALTQAQLAQVVSQDPAGLSSVLARAASSLSAGELAQAARQLPTLAAQHLVQLHTAALRQVLHVLCAITVLSALVVLAMLRRSPRQLARETTDDPAPLSGVEG